MFEGHTQERVARGFILVGRRYCAQWAATATGPEARVGPAERGPGSGDGARPAMGSGVERRGGDAELFEDVLRKEVGTRHPGAVDLAQRNGQRREVRGA